MDFDTIRKRHRLKVKITRAEAEEHKRIVEDYEKNHGILKTNRNPADIPLDGFYDIDYENALLSKEILENCIIID